MKKWIEQAQILKNIAQASDLFAKKFTAKEIFGSNHLFTQKNTVGSSYKHNGQPLRLPTKWFLKNRFVLCWLRDLDSNQDTLLQRQ